MKHSILYLAILILCINLSCQDQIKFTNDSTATLQFSTDTVLFDTIFTSIGSTTMLFKIYNPNINAVKTNVKLAGGANSYYRLNVDGYATNQVNNLEIMGKDSAFVFVEVNIDPQNSNSPMIITDSIQFNTNGNTQNVKLVSYGQNVHLYTDSVIDTRTWINDKPYLIYESILVDSLETLTIEPGVKVYFHNNSSLLVKGTLVVDGDYDSKVTFQGDRLDEWYKDIPGAWGATFFDSVGTGHILGGIHLLQGSINNKIDNAIIKNGNIGIQIDYYDEKSSEPTLTLSNSLITGMSLFGIEARTTTLLMYNTTVSNCGYYCIRFMFGGSYEVYHSTIANYFPKDFGSRTTEALAFNNYYEVEKKATVFPMYAKFGNCIIYGDNKFKDELIFDSLATSVTPFELEFDHCMIKLSDKFDFSNENVYKELIHHPDSLPRFINTDLVDFRLDTLSTAKDKGSTVYSTIFTTDQDGNNRTGDAAPDLGAYERIE